MAILYDSISSISQVSTATNTFSFTNTAGNIVLVHGHEGAVSTSQVTGVTYAGTALVKIDGLKCGSGRYTTAWAWDITTNGDAPTGANNVVVTHSVPVINNRYYAVSYSGVASTGDTDTSVIPTSTATIDGTLTTTGTNHRFVMFLKDNSGNRTYSFDKGTIRLNTDPGGLSMGDYSVSTATTETVTATDTGGATIGKATISVELVEAAVGPVAPTVTTQAVTAIAETTATGNGNVTDDGGATITERGVCWATTTGPTTADSTATSAGTTGVFTASITGLTAGTEYFVRAYAINSEGTSYGSEVTFTTDDVPDAFVVGNWTLTDLTTGGDARIAISALPADNGSAITDLEYKKDAGAWTSLGGTTTGNYDLSIFTDGVSADVLIRAVNAVGNGADSDLKSVTTTNAAYVPASTDVMYVLDISNTANSPEGEFRPVTLDDLKTYFNTP